MRSERKTSDSLRRLHYAIAGILLFILSLSAVGLAGCTESRNDKKGTAGKGIEHVTCRLKWLFNASVAGEIWARSSGIFRKNGLDVKLMEGGLEHDAIKDLELGRVQFAIASADQIIRAYEKGAHIVVLAQIFRKNPLGWIYDGTNLHIDTPQGLKGLTVGITYGGNDEAIFTALLNRYRISKDEINLYAINYDYSPFWKNEVNLWPVYSNVEGIILSRKMAKNGLRPCFFDPDAFGIHFVANSLITSERLYAKRPGLVRRFTKALINGWQGAMEEKNEQAVAEAVHRLDRDTPLDVIKRQLNATRALVLPKDNEAGLGKIDVPSWRQTYEIMLEQGLVSRRVDLDRLLAGPPP
ncbi:MAG: ABC transporter substrate-binding protein [Desulfobacteraceae bacterium]|nr:ABC transporter substrate-binding protein [Desulfobacteraceae bacterium]